jgi:hypothetical protein
MEKFLDGLRHLYYIVGQDQVEVRSQNRHSAGDTSARTRETIAQSEAFGLAL